VEALDAGVIHLAFASWVTKPAPMIAPIASDAVADGTVGALNTTTLSRKLDDTTYSKPKMFSGHAADIVESPPTVATNPTPWSATGITACNKKYNNTGLVKKADDSSDDISDGKEIGKRRVESNGEEIRKRTMSCGSTGMTSATRATGGTGAIGGSAPRAKSAETMPDAAIPCDTNIKGNSGPDVAQADANKTATTAAVQCIAAARPPCSRCHWQHCSRV